MKSSRICKVEDCTRYRHAGGYCAPHYRRWKVDGDPKAHVSIRRERMGKKHLGRESSHTIKASCKPTTKDLYWAAGFLDGEGFFGGIDCSRQTHQITGTQKSTELLFKLQKLFGGTVGMKTPHRRAHRGGDGVVHYWAAYGARARGIMLTLFLLLSKKRQLEIRRAIKSTSQSTFVGSAGGAG